MREISWIPSTRKEIESAHASLTRGDESPIKISFPGFPCAFTVVATASRNEELSRTFPTAIFSTATEKNDPTFYYSQGDAHTLSKMKQAYSVSSDFVGLYDEYSRTGFVCGSDELGLFRSLVVGFASTLLEDLGNHPVHGSMMQVNGKGVIFIGEHGAGKTTSLYHLQYLAPRSRTQILTDDWSFASTQGNNTVMTTFDKTVTLDPSFLEKYPYLKAIVQQKKMNSCYKKEYCQPHLLFENEKNEVESIALKQVVVLENLPGAPLLRTITPDRAAELIVDSTYHMPDCYPKKREEHLVYWRKTLRTVDLFSFNTDCGSDLRKNYSLLEEALRRGAHA